MREPNVLAWAASPPLDLPRQIMRRALIVAVMGILLMLAVGLSRMRDNVREELQAARVLALLVERLSTAQGLDDEQARRVLQQWQAEGQLRHLSLQVQDGHGQSVLSHPAARPDAGLVAHLHSALSPLLPAPPPFTVAWVMARPAGAAWTVTLGADPDSEQAEALRFVLESAGTVALVSAGLLLVMTWNTRAAFRPLSLLLAAMARLRQGDSQPLRQLPAMSVSEMQSIADALRALAEALEQAEAERRLLAQKVLTLQEDERQRLARELHDEFGQHLTALRVDAAWLARQVSAHPAQAEVVAGMAAHCEAIQRDIRAVLARLQPLGHSAVDADRRCDAQRLAQMLQELVAAWQRPGRSQPEAAFTRMHLRLTARDAAGRPTHWPQRAMLPQDLALTLYRISQEALTNAARHAQAHEVTVGLCWIEPAAPDEPAHIEWSVVDDGVGVPDPAAALRRGNGLAGIKERLWARGADLCLEARTAESARAGFGLSATLCVGSNLARWSGAKR